LNPARCFLILAEAAEIASVGIGGDEGDEGDEGGGGDGDILLTLPPAPFAF
jgi:hypothetical protein